MKTSKIRRHKNTNTNHQAPPHSGVFSYAQKEKHMKKPRHYRHNLCMPRPARELIKKYRHEKNTSRPRPTILYR